VVHRAHARRAVAGLGPCEARQRGPATSTRSRAPAAIRTAAAPSSIAISLASDPARAIPSASQRALPSGSTETSLAQVSSRESAGACSMTWTRPAISIAAGSGSLVKQSTSPRCSTAL
jgi:hypothetical protein